MDIAKIRKKAKEQESGRRTEDQPAPQDALIPAAAQTVMKAEMQGHVIPGEVQPAGSETIQVESRTQEPSGNNALAGSNKQEGGVRQADDEVQMELLTFSLGREEFAFEVAEVEEIIRLQKMTKVPTIQSYVIGITSLRGKIIPVLDLKARLNLKHTGEAPEYGTEEDPGGNRESKILIIDGPKGFIGATIDRVLGVVSLAKDRVLEPPAHLNEAEVKYIKGIVIFEKRFISVLRAEDAMNIEIG